jgi:hypothetical protein
MTTPHITREERAFECGCGRRTGDENDGRDTSLSHL